MAAEGALTDAWCVEAVPVAFADWCALEGSVNAACPAAETPAAETTDATTDDAATDETTDDAAAASCDADTPCEGEDEVCMTVSIAETDDTVEGFVAETADAYPASECTTQANCDTKVSDTEGQDTSGGYTFEVSCGAAKLVVSFAALALASAM